MDQHELQNILLETTYTKTDYLRRVRIIREYLEERFFKGNDLRFPDYLGLIKASQHDREAFSMWNDEIMRFFTKDNVYTLINSLAENIKVLPVLTVYLPVNLDDYQIDELGKWFRKSLSPILIMDIHCNPAIISGCAYVWNGKYHDFSLHKLIDIKQDIVNRIISEYAKF
jgi:hypothetical protein